ncbi:MAG TPA: GNAT family N-acetyltransferase [Ignavibacteria bacterium]|nr:GNAT family N-acetyltransferase [Bacteroidota bacterium]HRE12146.1 GNAT family N-acetyltransferase [Ignavibacteria bacterium]HRF65772.1 GNAT family N-acetyltransferase [Ignavibacteria bacterium]HRJ03225.1 GNAT family N-acetyltransferase [Ignavibacteria bacterium]HRJ85147.1 GNAT family N-acetyltransferase [Ignavibacteria bacterium]
MKPIVTERLIIREFRPTDLGEIYRILDVELKFIDSKLQDSSIAQRKEWLEWTIQGYKQNRMLLNPPYGEHAIVLKDSLQIIGACGFVPVLAPLGLVPYYRYIADAVEGERNYPEVGIFFAVSSHYQCRGFAHEAAAGLIKYGFETLKLQRIVGITHKYNNPSMAVLKRLGMKIETLPEHKWMQVVGIAENNEEWKNNIKKAG